MPTPGRQLLELIGVAEVTDALRMSFRLKRLTDIEVGRVLTERESMPAKVDSLDEKRGRT